MTDEAIIEQAKDWYNASCQPYEEGDVEGAIREAIRLARASEREWVSVDKNNPPRTNGLWAMSVYHSATKKFLYWDIGFGGYDDEDGRILDCNGDQISDLTLENVEYFLAVPLPQPPTA